MNKNIEILVKEWENAVKIMLTKRDFSIQQIENLLKETYRICTLYCDKDMVPRGMCKIFAKIQSFLSFGVDAYYINEYTTPSDSAQYDAVAFIIEEIEHGFYTGNYECVFPNLKVDDNKGNSHILNLEGDFLDAFINANR